MAIELPEFATGAINEVEPTPAEKESGWTLGDAPPSAYFNWLHRLTYQSLKDLVELGALQKVNAISIQAVGGSVAGVGFDLEDIVHDPVSGILIAISRDGTPNDVIATSDDEGISFTERLSGASIGSGPSGKAASAGNWALFKFRSGADHYYAENPYTAWSQVSGVFSATDRVRGSVVSIVDGSASVIISVGFDSSRILLAPTGSAPTSGDFTSIDLSGVGAGVSDVRGVATDGTTNVVGALSGGVSAILWAPISEGGTAGDWTLVVLPDGTSAPDIAWNGQTFLAVNGEGDVFRSSDGIAWEQVQDLADLGTSRRLFADPQTGIFVRNSTSGIYAARGSNPLFGLAAPDSTIASLFAFDPESGRVFGRDSPAQQFVRSI